MIDWKPRVEVLAPAGSMESMMAAVQAGADAIYMGGSRFGARAYADNPEEDRFLEAIDYAHLHGCRLYMTVNTLVKEQEFGQLYDFLKPYYECGLDAVIVQDMGVFSWIRRQFPDLAIHASTQMTVTGWRSAAMLREMGATRVVTARELSLEEIASIRDHVDIEIESFVHGALCYCYSGQCLLSSLIGGRSGNRGRCAQPCRLPYEVTGGGGDPKKERYLLSLKDLCTLDILPDIIEAGVYSLKIEGRMKSPRYTAGVVSVYRNYVDRYLEKGRQGYHVDPADRQMLLDLFDRGGFTEGYYRQHNGRDMVALKEKPAFREGNQALFDRIDREYVNHRRQEPVKGRVAVHEGEPVKLSLATAAGRLPRIFVEVCGAVVSTAQNQPLSEEKLRRQMNRTGNEDFFFEELDCDLSGNCFLPLQALNELRRNGMERLKKELQNTYRRTAAQMVRQSETGEHGSEPVYTKTGTKHQRSDSFSDRQEWRPRIHVSLEEPESFETVLAHRSVDEICLDAVGFEAENWSRMVQACHEVGKDCGLILPHIFRKEAEQYLKKYRRELTEAGFDEMILRSQEEISLVRELGLDPGMMVFDANLYALNREAAGWMRQMGAKRLTLPLELNSRELEQLAGADGGESGSGGLGEGDGWELIAYGYLPVMVSAQCVQRTTKGCNRKPGILFMKDRTGKELPVKNHCRFCYNTIYNPSPLSLLGQEKTTARLRPEVLRLSFTMETPRQTQAVMDAYVDHFLYGKDTKTPFDDFTRGHMKRGVE